MPEPAQPTAPHQITELKVSGHTMALEPGLYCVFNAPGGPAAAADTGLPGVRVTAAPGPHAASVSVAAFTADGWIGADAGALVRVKDRTAEVLVTVYQASNSTGEAPQLSVVRLSGNAGTATPGANPRPAPDDVEVVAHVYAIGDIGGRLGERMGQPGSQRWIEGFGISPVDGVPQSDVEYQAVLGRGWLSPWSEGGQFCGSRGMSLPILGLRVRLRGGSAATHQVALSASFVDGTVVGPVGSGEPCEAPSLAALESFEVEFRPVSAKQARARQVKAPAQPEPQPAQPRAKRVPSQPAPPPQKPAAKKAGATKRK